MIRGSLAKRYAKALMAIAKEKGTVETWREELEALNKIWEEQEALRTLLLDKALKLKEKKGILRELTKTLPFSQESKDFLDLLTDKNRLIYLPDIVRQFKKLADELLGQVQASVVAAASLSDTQRQQLQAGLEKLSGKKVIMDVREDPELIGGLMAEVGGLTYDGSLRTQLHRWSEQMLQSEKAVQ